MTFLEICQDFVRNADISLSGPLTVQNQTGTFRLVVDWVRKSWVYIQDRHENWRFMRREFLLDLVPDQDRYTYQDATDRELGTSIADFSRWFLSGEDGDLPYLIRPETNVGTSSALTPYSWREWVALRYADNVNNSARYPSRYTVDPDDRIVVYPIPQESGYSLRGEYKAGPQFFENDNDEPRGLARRYQDAIMWHAMWNYAQIEVLPEIERLANSKYKEVMKLLERNELPAVGLGDSMV